MAFVKNFIMGNVVNPVKTVVSAGISAHELAASIAVGVVGGVFPIVGTTAAICLLLTAVASFFGIRTNMVIVQVVNLLVTPLCLAMVPVFMHQGENLFGAEHLDPSAFLGGMKKEPWATLTGAKWVVVYMVVCFCVTCVPAVLVLYSALRPVLGLVLPEGPNENKKAD